jgi:molecular chaperone DnaK
MVADAEQHRAEDAQLRELIDARNELDAIAHQVERRLNELGDSVPSHERSRAEMLVTDARQAVSEDAPLDRIRALTGELQGIFHGLGATGAGAGGGDARSTPSDGEGAADDDVIDAEFTTN